MTASSLPPGRPAAPGPPSAGGARAARSVTGDLPNVGSPDSRSTGPARPTLPHLVLLPTLNEEEGIRATLEEFRTVARFADGQLPPILVIDGGSTDGTTRIAREYGCEVLRQTGRGKGTAIRDGLGWAVTHGYGAVSVLDADATYPADRLPALFRLLDDGFDVVIGVRRPDEPARITPRNLVHRIGNGFLGFSAARASGGPILDVCSGFWGIRTERLDMLGLESTGFEIESEIFVKSFRRGLTVCQIPIAYRKRLGTAKLHAVRDGVRIFLSILHNSGRPSILRPAADGRSSDPRTNSPGTQGRPHARIISLAAVLLTLDPEFVVVASSKNRRREAAKVVERLPPGSYTVRIATASTDPSERFSGPGPWHSSDSGTFALKDRPVVVSLPDPSPRVPDLGHLVVSVPGHPWVLQLGKASDPEAPDPRVPSAPHPPIPPVRFPRPSAWSILGTVLDPSRDRKAHAILGANLEGAGATLRVLPVTRPPAPGGPVRSFQPEMLGPVPGLVQWP